MSFEHEEIARDIEKWPKWAKESLKEKKKRFFFYNYLRVVDVIVHVFLDCFVSGNQNGYVRFIKLALQAKFLDKIKELSVVHTLQHHRSRGT